MMALLIQRVSGAPTATTEHPLSLLLPFDWRVAMPLFRYYVSARVTDPAPPLETMETINADSPVQAASKLLQQGRIARGATAQWIHVVTDLDDRGQPRGFQSIAVAAVQAT